MAGPGCNSTAALLALLPLAGRIDDAVVDIKAGVSGAGREATEETHFVRGRQRERLQARRSPSQRGDGAGAPGRPLQLPHPPAADRPGILASCYSNPTEALTKEEARTLFERAYAGEPFVDVVDGSPRTRDVRGSNRAQVHVTVVDGRVISLAAIDNLWKAQQARRCRT